MSSDLGDFDVLGSSVAAVKDHVDGDPALAAAALVQEQAGGSPRSTLVAWLEREAGGVPEVTEEVGPVRLPGVADPPYESAEDDAGPERL